MIKAKCIEKQVSNLHVKFNLICIKTICIFYMQSFLKFESHRHTLPFQQILLIMRKQATFFLQNPVETGWIVFYLRAVKRSPVPTNAAGNFGMLTLTSLLLFNITCGQQAINILIYTCIYIIYRSIYIIYTVYPYKVV